MGLQFKNKPQPRAPTAPGNKQPRVEYQVGWLNVPLAPQGMPMGVPAINRVSRMVKMDPPPIAMPGSNLNLTIMGGSKTYGTKRKRTRKKKGSSK